MKNKKIITILILISGIFALYAVYRHHESKRMHFPSFESFNGKKGILEVVRELELTARAANGGALGCGSGGIMIKTESGSELYETGLDPMHVFGDTVDIKDVHKLLNSRANYSLTGKPGPMSGEVSTLCYVSLNIIALAKDKSSLPIIIPLLNDESEIIRSFTIKALKEIAEEHPETKESIEEALKSHSV
ncbi:HEAT repeat domain-containing protein [Kiritimatiellota bacterium B12222]|nr:HEAT repeat domain-containing protein [Kiritimatiellota bacterium B12222]